MWPAISKRNLLGFRFCFEEYPNLIDTTPYFFLLLLQRYFILLI
ncbi:hypothetical protein HMPREF9151_00069 [Hoylesella saccharolytica F0055]|uniref:Uncharacterized protein n=1 Tax=Hoylesella saccharolytica F0055 TaxID=1127699 RepID=L1NLB8_9BACT|nr:hypothetical protein HMPREF9151_00069 [Hoylesella saccharolytica F0055]